MLKHSFRLVTIIISHYFCSRWVRLSFASWRSLRESVSLHQGGPASLTTSAGTQELPRRNTHIIPRTPQSGWARSVWWRWGDLSILTLSDNSSFVISPIKLLLASSNSSIASSFSLTHSVPVVILSNVGNMHWEHLENRWSTDIFIRN